MATEAARRELRTRLLESLGPEATDTLMEELGALGREQLATRADLQLGFAQAGTERAELRTELKTDTAQLRTEFAELRTDFGDLRTELKTDMAALKTAFAELRAAVAERLEQQTRHLMFGMIGSMATISGIAFGAARLG